MMDQHGGHVHGLPTVHAIHRIPLSSCALLDAQAPTPPPAQDAAESGPKGKGKKGKGGAGATAAQPEAQAPVSGMQKEQQERIAKLLSYISSTLKGKAEVGCWTRDIGAVEHMECFAGCAYMFVRSGKGQIWERVHSYSLPCAPSSTPCS